MLAPLHRHFCQQLLQPGLPLVDPVEPHGRLRVQQRHCGVAVQLLQGATQGPSALLQQGAQLRLKALALADEVGLAGVLQEGRGRDIAGGAWRTNVHFGQQISLLYRRQGGPLSKIEVCISRLYRCAHMHVIWMGA